MNKQSNSFMIKVDYLYTVQVLLSKRPAYFFPHSSTLTLSQMVETLISDLVLIVN